MTQKGMWCTLFVLFGVGLTVAAFGTAAAEEIKIGVLAPLTGPASSWGEYTRDAAEMAVDEINGAGGVKGVGKLKLIYEDSEGNPKAGVTAVTKLVNRHKVHVVLGEALSSVTLPTMAVTQRAKVPQLTAISGSPKVTGSGNKWIFRTQINQKYSGDLLAEWAVNRLNFTKIAILHANEPFGAGGANSFRAGLAKRNIKPAAFERFNRDDKDFSGQLRSIKESGAKLLGFFGFHTEAAIAFKQAKQLGLNLTILTNDALANPKFLELAGADAEGVIISSMFIADDPDPLVQEFVKRFKTRYNREPNQFHGSIYDAVYILREAFERASSTNNAKLREALLSIQELRGVTGVHKFDGNGDDRKSFLLMTVKNRKYVFYAK
ncbi:MAG: ABC transporter substrate-binding protein [Candidatus Methylomirabilia bacterium]